LLGKELLNIDIRLIVLVMDPRFIFLSPTSAIVSMTLHRYALQRKQWYPQRQ